MLLAGLAVGQSPITAMASGDAVSGGVLYEVRCLGCHGNVGTENTLGPSLVGIFGRKPSIVTTEAHSSAVFDPNAKWNDASLRIFLAAPTKTLAGTNMPDSIADPGEIDDLIAYLKTLR